MLRKAVYFIILLSFRRLVLAALALSSPSLSIVNVANALNNTTVPFNSTGTGPTSLNDRPPEPLELRTDWPGWVTVTFYHYGDPMFRFAAVRCANDASEDGWETHGDAMDHVIGESELVYKYLNVVFTVFPRPAMTWNMFCWMMELVNEFITDYDPMAFYFNVTIVGVIGLAASGNMTAFGDDI